MCLIITVLQLLLNPAGCFKTFCYYALTPLYFPVTIVYFCSELSRLVYFHSSSVMSVHPAMNGQGEKVSIPYKEYQIALIRTICISVSSPG